MRLNSAARSARAGRGGVGAIAILSRRSARRGGINAPLAGAPRRYDRVVPRNR